MKYGKSSLFYIPLNEIDKFVAKSTMGVYNLDRDELWAKTLPIHYNSYYVELKVYWLTDDCGYACGFMDQTTFFGFAWFPQVFVERYNKPELANGRGSWTKMTRDTYNNFFIGPRKIDDHDIPFYKVWGKHPQVKSLAPPPAGSLVEPIENPTTLKVNTIPMKSNNDENKQVLTNRQIYAEKKAWAVDIEENKGNRNTQQKSEIIDRKKEPVKYKSSGKQVRSVENSNPLDLTNKVDRNTDSLLPGSVIQNKNSKGTNKPPPAGVKKATKSHLKIGYLSNNQ
jgi:hypothetical protein